MSIIKILYNTETNEATVESTEDKFLVTEGTTWLGYPDGNETYIKISPDGSTINQKAHNNNFQGKVGLNKPLNTAGFTVAELPDGQIGDVCFVTDALTSELNIPLVGGGINVMMAFFNNTNWISK